MKTAFKILAFSFLLWGCEEEINLPDPTLEIQFKRFVRTACCVTSTPIDDQESIDFRLLPDSMLIVSIQEDNLTEPEILELNAMGPDAIQYIFEIETDNGDREIFMSGENVSTFGGGLGVNFHKGISLSNLRRNFIIPLNIVELPVQGNSTIELSPGSDVTIHVRFTSEFSDLSIVQSTLIQL